MVSTCKYLYRYVRVRWLPKGDKVRLVQVHSVFFPGRQSAGWAVKRGLLDNNNKRTTNNNNNSNKE